MYIGARYLGKDTVVFSDGNGVSYGMIYTGMTESEAKGRHDFEPVYEAIEAKKASKKINFEEAQDANS